MDHRPHIVVVEDEAAQRQLLLDYLSRQGFRVTGFESGAVCTEEFAAPTALSSSTGLTPDGHLLLRCLC